MRTIHRDEWVVVKKSIDQQGFAKLAAVLSEEECSELVSGYENVSLYRSTINMARYRFGAGEYRYFSYPLPELIKEVRRRFYPELADLANQWNERLAIASRYPDDHSVFLTQCHDRHQLRPTPLILRYGKGGFNTLHQDLYGEVYFPFQVVFMLTQHGVDYTGGQFVLTEQVPRAQSRARVVEAALGDAIVFTTNFRPVPGVRGHYRSTFRHGVSEVLSGTRYALGVIFHDAP